jgi:uncharacterized Fe-S cluster-containing radical SAM superfamily protein
MRIGLWACAALLPATAAFAEPASDVQARLDEIEKIQITADVRTGSEEPIADERVAEILEEAAETENNR